MASVVEAEPVDAPAGVPSAELGIVVIGRNEGPRLGPSLRSTVPAERCVVYVDSGSRDASVATARDCGARIVELDAARPFSAARARNEGFARLRSEMPRVEFVQFLDGDCTLAAGWIDAARAALEAEPRCAVVVGHLHERRPEASRYNRLCALEWRSPPGRIDNFGALGGIMMVRASAFTAVGGFDERVIAGEDSEFGVRIGASGFTVVKIDAAMATHDADIERFSQWWRRALRSGHAIGQRSWLHGSDAARDCVRERRSAIAWGLAFPAAMLVLALPTRGASIGALALGYALLGFRIFSFRRGRGDSVDEARLYSTFTVVGKLAEGLGLLRFFWNRATGRFRIMEYK